ncbi:molybdopterin oxidoreductase family protein [Motiliproteus sp. MSK22-1]|uniref:molybdopterin oxidoreductase family protein n=1 Tax=Motiliproteus sp. MSK22-1 TaxID=1897630 RepID=UPI000977FFC7|nr:molybdopterin oxidoreductase family protein [Motiliproteus sp. MSK22-1]OMH39047.1 dehydrogenase [Motiliproteus sp. MSK22-1]
MKQSLERRYAVCPHDCPSTCALEVEKLDDHHIGRIHGSKHNSYTAGVICAKVARYAERVHHPDRLGRPLKRVGEKGIGISAFEPISWEEALTTIVDRFQSIQAESGPESIWPYFYAGTMGWVQRGSANRLRHAMGYARQKETICVSIANAGWLAGVGAKRGVDAREITDSELIVVWGGNPVHTQINVMTQVAKARKKGAKLVVVDPYRTATAQQADIHLMPKPGTDGALACGVMNVLLKEGFVDQDYLDKYTDFDAEIRTHLMQKTPAWAAEVTGIDAEQIVTFARLYGRSQRSYLRMGYGMSRSRNGASNMHAVSCLPALTGAWQYPGGGALFGHSELYKGLDTRICQGQDQGESAARELDMSRIGPVLTGDPRDLGDGPPVKALFIQNCNPMAVAPESAKVRQGFMRDDLFTVVHEQQMTETAAMADIVLPATTFLEHDDIYTASGHTHLQVSKAVIKPYKECRSNYELVCELIHRLGGRHSTTGKSAFEVIEQALDHGPLPTAEKMHQDQGVDCALCFEKAHFLDGFGHPDERFHFRADWLALGPLGAVLPQLPDHCTLLEQADQQHPFRLVTAPARTFLNSSFTETPGSRKKEQRPRAMIHPDDCLELGLEPDSIVLIGNSRGQVRVHVRPFDGLQRGVVIVEGVWPNADFIDGVGINVLVSAEAAAPNGGAVFHDTKVWLEASHQTEGEAQKGSREES